MRRLLAIALGLLLVGAADARADAPNVLVVMTDDQPYGSENKMPWLSAHEDEFTEFTQLHVNNALCCPARATFLSGLYSHNTGVELNDGEDFDDANTLATAFDGAGYRTGLFGKYLNGYPFGRGNSYIPPGWDRWAAFTDEAAKGAYYDYRLNVDGAVAAHGDGPADYSTDLLAQHLRDFIAEDSPDPFFAVFTPYGSHRPWTAAPRHQGAFDSEPVDLPENFDQRAKTTHRWWRARPHVDRAQTRGVTRRIYASLLSEDEALESAYDLLADRGELEDTVIVFFSDNGYSLGGHRWIGKQCAWEECERVPLLVRAPGAATVASTDAVVSNVDLAPTLAELGGVSFPAGDGTSLVGLMDGSASSLGRPALLRAKRDPEANRPEPPSLWGLRTPRWKYIRWSGAQRDLYDLDVDPGEQRDLADRNGYGSVVDRLNARMASLRSAGKGLR